MHCCFCFNETATTEIDTLSLHDALPILQSGFHHDSLNHAMAVIERLGRESGAYVAFSRTDSQLITKQTIVARGARRSEEHTPEIQSRQYLVCCLLLDHKKKKC